MDPDKRRLADRILDEALDRSPEEQRELVALRCGDDEELAALVERLLEATTETADLGHGGLREDLLQGALNRVAGAPPDETPPEGGRHIGPYRLVEPIGRGGMGEVHLAEQLAPIRRRVALKIIRPGAGTQELLTRFEAERQALAMMNDSRIARIFDAGVTDDGMPYFAMEHVPGPSIVAYCDQRHLDLEERIALARDVCLGVQHAHQKGILHRDLKPPNVLVVEEDGRPIPKIIDFGIAKAIDQRLTGQTLHTELGRLIGTPEYISPERVERPTEADTRADIYSLGVLLYEMLCGVRPFDFSGALAFSQIQRTLLEEEPPPPSARLGRLPPAAARRIAERRSTNPPRLEKLLAGELDWIVLRALEKDPDRRYPTAQELADDLLAFLEGRPVAARRPTLTYRIGKFVARHRLIVTSAALVFGVSILGTVVSTLGWLRAQRAEEAMAVEARTARRVTEFVSGVFGDLDPEAMGITLRKSLREQLDRSPSAEDTDPIDRVRPTDLAADLVRADLMESTVRRVDAELQLEPEAAAAITSTLARAARELGFLEVAESIAVRAVERHTALHGPSDPRTHAAVLERAHSTILLGGELGEIEAILDEERVALDADPAAPTELRVQVRFLHALLAHTRGNVEEAAKWQAETWNLATETLGWTHPTTVETVVGLSSTFLNDDAVGRAGEVLAELLRRLEGEVGPDAAAALRVRARLANVRNRQGRWSESVHLARKAASAVTEAKGSLHPESLRTRSELAVALWGEGRIDEAASLFEGVVEDARAGLGPHHGQTISCLGRLSVLRRIQGRHEEAAQLMQTAAADAQDVLGPTHPETLYLQTQLAATLVDLGQPERAVGILRATVDEMRRHLASDNGMVLNAEGVLADVLLLTGEWTEAESLRRSQIERASRTLGPEHSDVLISLVRWAESLLLLGEVEEAAEHLEVALESSHRLLGEEHLYTLSAELLEGRLLWTRGELEAALAALESTTATHRRVLGDDHLETAKALFWTARVLLEVDRREEAILLFEEVADMPLATWPGHRIQAAALLSLVEHGPAAQQALWSARYRRLGEGILRTPDLEALALGMPGR